MSCLLTFIWRAWREGGGRCLWSWLATVSGVTRSQAAPRPPSLGASCSVWTWCWSLMSGENKRQIIMSSESYIVILEVCGEERLPHLVHWGPGAEQNILEEDRGDPGVGETHHGLRQEEEGWIWKGHVTMWPAQISKVFSGKFIFRKTKLQWNCVNVLLSSYLALFLKKLQWISAYKIKI